MKAITVRNPYAWAIAVGWKPVENRTRPTSYRGDVAIHAGAAWFRGAELDRRVIRAFWGAHGSGLDPAPSALAPEWWRAVVAVAELYDSHWRATGCCVSEWANPDAGAHLLLRNVRRLREHVPAVGALGLWTLPDDVERAVREQLPVPA